MSSDSTVQAMWGYAAGNRTAITIVAGAIGIAAIAFVIRRVLNNRAEAKIWSARLNFDDNTRGIGQQANGRQRG